MITVTYEGKTSVKVTDGQHSIISDIIKSAGGEEEGMTPHELVEGALGACTALTLELYAKRKNWKLDGLKVEVKIVKEGPETEIHRTIVFGPETTLEQQARLLDIADKCPVHKLLESKIEIKSV